MRQDSLLGFSEKPSSWQRLLPFALLLSVTFALYGATLYFDFIWDDFDYVVENYAIQGLSLAHLRAIWTHSFSGQYTPLHHSLLALIYFLSGLAPFGYHLTQLAIHAAAVCVLYVVLSEIESARVALLASLLFAVYPPNIETVAWVSETKSTLAFLFFLLSFHFYIRLRSREGWQDGVWCAVFLVLSLLTKISTVVAPAIFLLYDYRQEGSIRGILQKKKLWALAGVSLISAVFVAIQLHGSSMIVRSYPDRLADGVLTGLRLPPSASTTGYYGGFWVHLLNLPQFLLFYLRMLVIPYPLSAWRMVAIYGGLNWALGAAWSALAGLMWLLYRSPRELQFWQLWFYIFLSPVLQIVPNSTWVADRYLYIPAIGAFVLASRLFFYLKDRYAKTLERRGLEALAVVILLSFAWLTYHHLPAWRNELSLWQATTPTCSTSAFCHSRLGKAELQGGNPEAAIKELLQAVQIRPAPAYLINLGDAYADGLGNYQQALLVYSNTRQMWGPLPLYFWAKVAKAYYLKGDLVEAGRVIEAGEKVDVDEPSLLLVKGFLLWKQGRPAEARRCVERVLAMNSLYPQRSNPEKFVEHYWGHPDEVGRMMTELGPLNNRLSGPASAPMGQSQARP